MQRRWPIRQLDVNNAFLQGSLQEEVYMRQPPSFESPEYPNYICKLRKPIYGLKQASHAWYTELTSFLICMGFVMSRSDNSLFILHHGGYLVYVLVYVDDIVIIGSDNSLVNRIIQSLSNYFSLKDQGILNYFLGVEVLPYNGGLVLSQTKYILNILHDTNMHECNAMTTPMSSSSSLTIDPLADVVDITAYRRILGKLQYLLFTRFDIAFVVNKLAQFMHHPQQLHLQAIKRLLRYLKHTSMLGLHISCKPNALLCAYSDSDWAGNLSDRTSTTGYVLYHGDTPISWSSKKQRTVARSSIEAEYRVVTSVMAETNWVMNLLSELQFPITYPPKIFCDNLGATYLCENPVFHSRMKHIALDFHFVRDQVQRKLITVDHVNSMNQVADLLTKSLPKSLFQKQFNKLGLVDTWLRLRGRKEFK